MSIGKRRDSHELFIDSQFSYCPLVWIFHSRKNNIKINNIHERCLWLIYGDKRSSYEELFEKNVSVSVHHRNNQVLATEMYRVKSDLSPKIFSGLSCQTEKNPASFGSAICKDCIMGVKVSHVLAKDIGYSPSIKDIFINIFWHYFFFFRKCLQRGDITEGTARGYS